MIAFTSPLFYFLSCLPIFYKHITIRARKSPVNVTIFIKNVKVVTLTRIYRFAFYWDYPAELSSMTQHSSTLLAVLFNDLVELCHMVSDPLLISLDRDHRFAFSHKKNAWNVSLISLVVVDICLNIRP